MAEKENKGVQELIDQLRSEGVEKAKTEAEKIVKDAKTEANKIIQNAKTESEKIMEKIKEERKSQETAFSSSLEIAARDVCLRLKNELTEIFKLEILSSIKSVLNEKDFMEKLIIELGKRSVDGGKSGEAIVIELPVNENEEKDLTDYLLTKLKGKLEKGVELNSGSTNSIVVKFKDSGCQIELSDTGVAELVSERLVPRFRKYLEGLR